MRAYLRVIGPDVLSFNEYICTGNVILEMASAFLVQLLLSLCSVAVGSNVAIYFLAEGIGPFVTHTSSSHMSRFQQHIEVYLEIWALASETHWWRAKRECRLLTCGIVRILLAQLLRRPGSCHSMPRRAGNGEKERQRRRHL